ncbi:MAG: long-chain-fatty-acid--CoA ligase [Desulfotomaculaceae bacterium]|nr:long-chain-fatty-acid--CoA ligase [Desulfotomaculaceae bacterium]
MGEMLERNARLFPEKLAYVCDDESVTFSKFRNRVYRLINALQDMKFVKGDRISILSKNSIRYFELYGAADRGGFILVPLNFRLKTGELAYLLKDSGARVLFYESSYADVVEELKKDVDSVNYYIALDGPGDMCYEEMLAAATEQQPEVDIDENDPAYIIYTSGTTGLPRGVVCSHRAQYQVTNILALEQGLRKDDSALDMMPLYHTGGHAVTQSYFYRGCTQVITTGFNPEQALQIVAKYKITTMQVVPAMLIDMLNHPNIERYDTSSLRIIFYASSIMPVVLLKKAIAKWGNVFFQSYGLTENGPTITVLPIEDHYVEGPERLTQRLASCGIPAANTLARVINDNGEDVKPGEIGEIITRGEQMMLGYWNMPELTAETIKEGWLYTGDLATVDEDGYIYIRDRKKDMIISGGENVYPREIEEYLYTHPAIKECAVIGVPHEKWIESVHAVIVLKDQQKATAEGITAYCKKELAGYKVPKSMEFVDELPKNPSGKILKKELRARYWPK